ncbi:hypothetical protein FJTKL_10382 [Diaporthe vaccinii]|uniref:Uncharacterized protein n=1 Tax=Diaporthe vaccinii TaxID=105482 RepID=A0ABR4EJZ3_9PEZI
MRLPDQTAGNPLHKNDDTTVMMGITCLRNGQCTLQMVADGQTVTIGTVEWIGETHCGLEGTLSLAPEGQATRRQTLV